MSGKRLGSFRAGDRSEYLTLFGLSRIAFVHPIPRQEDFGVVDFLCILAKEEGRHVYPESAFYVQVKSKVEPMILDADAIRWITHHMDHPLFLCFSDKATGELTFYSCSRLWFALFQYAEPTSVTLLPDSNHPPEHFEKKNGAPPEFKVHLGPPILRQNLAELEQNPGLAYSVIEPWIRTDASNIARRRVGRIAVSCIVEWQTNEPPGLGRYISYYWGQNAEAAEPAERDLVPMLTALAHHYRHHKCREKFEALRGFLQVLKPLLDDHGRRFADGIDGIDTQGG